MRTANPALNANTFANLSHGHSTEHMTLDGTVNKCFLLFFVMLLPAVYVWYLFTQGSALVMPLMLGGLIGGLILALVTVFKKEWATVTAPLYAGFEGLFIGGISALFESMFPNIVLQAVGLTFGVFFIMLTIYRLRIIKVTENFKLGIVAATGAVMLVYIVSIVLGFFGMNIPLIHESGPIGIIFSLVVVGIAALNLVLDFDFIEKGSTANAPKYMEFYAAFGLLVTLIWLYIEILNLLAKLRGRD